MIYFNIILKVTRALQFRIGVVYGHAGLEPPIVEINNENTYSEINNCSLPYHYFIIKIKWGRVFSGCNLEIFIKRYFISRDQKLFIFLGSMHNYPFFKLLS